MDALQIVKTLNHDHQPDLESVSASRSLMALPFVPRMFVHQQYNKIEASSNTGIQAVTQLLEYFKATWIDGQFGIQMWNVTRRIFVPTTN